MAETNYLRLSGAVLLPISTRLLRTSSDFPELQYLWQEPLESKVRQIERFLLCSSFYALAREPTMFEFDFQRQGYCKCHTIPRCQCESCLARMEMTCFEGREGLRSCLKPICSMTHHSHSLAGHKKSQTGASWQVQSALRKGRLSDYSSELVQALRIHHGKDHGACPKCGRSVDPIPDCTCPNRRTAHQFLSNSRMESTWTAERFARTLLGSAPSTRAILTNWS